MKNFLILMTLISIIIVSIFFSKDVYRYHIRFYYQVIKQKDYNSLVTDAKKRFKEINKDDMGSYSKLRDHVEELLLLYPADQELSQILGLIYIRLGYKKKGAQVIIIAQSNNRIPTDVVGEVVSALYEGNDYSDIIYFYENNEFNPNQTILYHYGVSLYMTRKYKNQLKIY